MEVSDTARPFDAATSADHPYDGDYYGSYWPLSGCFSQHIELTIRDSKIEGRFSWQAKGFNPQPFKGLVTEGSFSTTFWAAIGGEEVTKTLDGTFNTDANIDLVVRAGDRCAGKLVLEKQRVIKKARLAATSETTDQFNIPRPLRRAAKYSFKRATP